MHVEENSWFLIVSYRGVLKCLSMRRDKNREIFILGKTFLVSSMVGLPYNTLLSTETTLITNNSNNTHSNSRKEYVKYNNTEKHAEKRKKRSSNVFWIEKPSLPGLVLMYQKKSIINISHEPFSQVLFHSLGYKQAVIKDEYKSLFIAAAAMGGVERIFRVDGPVQGIHTINALSCPAEVKEYLPERIDANSRTLFVFAQKSLFCYSQLLSFLENTFCAHKEFILYHRSKDGLIDTFNCLMKDKRVHSLEVREYFGREYQAQIGAVHPETGKDAGSGFILSGTFFDTGFA